MSKKTVKTDFEIDNFDLDDGLNFDIPDFDLPRQNNRDRNPATVAGKSAKELSKSAATAILGKAALKKTIDDVFPEEFGRAISLVSDTKDSLVEIYENSFNQIKPTVNRLKRVTDKLIKEDDNRKPNAIKSKLKAWAKTADGLSSGPTKEQLEDAAISNELADIFKTQVILTQRNAAEEKAKDQIKENIENKRFDTQYSVLSEISLDINKLAQYKTNIESNWQRKTLEIQYRHLYIARDILVETKLQSNVLQRNLEGILKNTGLPEYTKLKNTERFGEHLRNRFVTNVQEGLFSKRANFIKDFSKNIGDKISEKIGEVKDGFESLIDQLEMGADFMNDDSGLIEAPSMTELGSSIVGSAIGEKVRNKLAKKLKKMINENPELAKKVGGKAALLNYWMNNIPQLAEEWKRGNNIDFGMMGSLKDLVRDSLPNLSNKVTFQSDDINTNNANANVPFTHLTRKSITEIIPGYLARIFRELQIIRTGDASIELTMYDHQSNQFTGRSNIINKLMTNSFSSDNTKLVNESLDKVLEKLDTSKLSVGERKNLRKFIYENSSNSRLFSPERLIDPETYKSMKYGKNANKFADIFKNHFSFDEDGEFAKTDDNYIKRATFANLANNVAVSGIGSNKAYIQNMINLGLQQELIDAGIITASDDIDKGSNTLSYNLALESDILSGGKHKRLLSKKRPGRSNKVNSITPTSTITNNTSNIDSSAIVILEDIRELLDINSNSSSVNALNINQQIYDTSKETTDTLSRIELLLIEMASRPMVTVNAGNLEDMNVDPSFFNLKVTQLPMYLFKKAKSTTMYLSSKIKASIGTLTGGAGKILGKAKDLLFSKKEAMEIWLENEMEPRITIAKLRLGLYYNEAGEKIKSWQELLALIAKTQTIYSRDENGELIPILTKEDLKNIIIPENGFISNSLKNIKRIGLTVFDKILGTANTIRGASKNVFALGWHFAKQAGSFLQAQDVYVNNNGTLEIRLLARVMRGGGYFHKGSVEPILEATAIKGEVIDRDGNVALTQEEFQSGLYDKYGLPISGLIGRTFNLAKKIGANVIGKIKNSAMFVKDKIKDGFNWLTGKMEPMAIFGRTSPIVKGVDKVVAKLIDIENILLSRLPERRKVFGDVDGDGIRENSLEDMARRRKEEQALSIKQNEDEKEKKSKIGLLGMLGGLLGGKKKKQEDEGDEEGSGDDGWLSTIATYLGIDWIGDKIKGRFGKKGRAARRRSRAGRTGVGGAASRGSKLARFGKAGLGGLALAGATTVAANSGMNLGILENPLVSTAAGVGLSMYGGSILSALGTGLMAAISSPLLLPALGIAAVGIGGYFLWKHLSKLKLDPMTKIRFAQYGLTEKYDDEVQMVYKLEKYLEDKVIYSNDNVKLDGNKVKIEEIYEIFEIEPSNSKHANRISALKEFISNRFQPVFFKHLVIIKSYKRPELANVNNSLRSKITLYNQNDKLNPKEKLDYINKTQLPARVYSNLISPFERLPRLVVGPTELENIVSSVKTEIEKNEKEWDKKNASFRVAFAPGSKPTDTKISPIATAGTVVSLDEAKKQKDAEQQNIKKLTDANNKPLVTDRNFLKVKSVTPSVIIPPTTLMGALDSIKYRSYGLVEMDYNKVQAILAVESILNNTVRIESDGEAVWEGNTEELFNTVGHYFGISDKSSVEALQFLKWFNGRFLGVYLTYTKLIYQFTQKRDPALGQKLLTPIQCLSVAKAISNANARLGGSYESIWRCLDSPWKNYELANNKEIVDIFITKLEKDSNKKLNEQIKQNAESSGFKKASFTDSNNTNLLTPSVKKEESTGWVDKLKNWWNDDKSSQPQQKASTGYGGGSTPSYSGSSGSGGLGSYAPPSGGYTYSPGAENQNTGSQASKSLKTDDRPTTKPNQVKDFGSGNPGHWQQLPSIKGNSYEGFKELAMAVAAMTGVDPNLLLAIANVESGFSTTATPGTSTAKGPWQFIDSTWRKVVKIYGSKYGIDLSTPPNDPRASALMAAELLKENYRIMKGSLGRSLTDADFYMGHFLGGGTAASFIKSMSKNPNQVAASMPEMLIKTKNGVVNIADANKWIFYKNPGNSKKGIPPSGPRTAQEIYNLMTNKMNWSYRSMKINGPGSSTQVAGTTSANEGSSPATGTPSTNTPAPITASSPDISKATPPIPETKPAESPKNPNIIKASYSPTSDTSSEPVSAYSGIGHSNPEAKQMKTQGDYNETINNKKIEGMTEILSQILSVNEKQLMSLSQIVSNTNALSKLSGALKDTPKESGSNSRSQKENGIREAVPNPPVSLRRSA